MPPGYARSIFLSMKFFFLFLHLRDNFTRSHYAVKLLHTQDSHSLAHIIQTLNYLYEG
jgi:hypothetical protein